MDTIIDMGEREKKQRKTEGIQIIRITFFLVGGGGVEAGTSKSVRVSIMTILCGL